MAAAGEGGGSAVGVDLGGTNARAALVDLDGGQVLDEVKVPVPESGRDPEAVADLVASLVAKVDPQGARGGVGIGFAGMLRGWSGIVANAPNFGWREVNLRALLRERLGDRVELYNDLAVITWGETCWGAARGARHVLCVFVGTGVGGCLVTDGKLYGGSSRIAGEIGHTKVIPDGRLCGCGQRGCVEAYASGRNIAARVQEELRGDPGSVVAKIAGGVEQIHAGHVDAAVAAGDAYATALWDEVSTLLGMVLANAVTLTNPERLVLGGGVWERVPELRRRVESRYRALVNGPSGEGCTLVAAALGDRAGVLGAASLIGMQG